MNGAARINAGTWFLLFAAILVSGLAVAAYTGEWFIAAIPFLIMFFYLGWHYNEFIFYLLIFTLPWSIEYKLSGTLGTDLPDEPLMVFTCFLFLASVMARPSIIQRSTWLHPLLVFLGIHFLWMMIAAGFSTDWLASAKFLLAKSWYIIAFTGMGLIVFRNKAGLRNTALVFLFSMIALTVVAVYRHYGLGLSFERINEAVTPFFRNHVNYSAMLVCTVPLLIAGLQLSRGKLFTRLFLALVMALVLVALFLSFARGAWLALLAGIAVYWLIRKRLLFRTFMAGMIFVLVAVIWLKSNDRYLGFAHDYRTTIFHTDFREHLVATYQLKDVSTAERFNRWIAGVRMIEDQWLTGFGPATFSSNYKPYMIPAFKTWVSDNKDRSTVHNYFLLTIIEQGLPGLLFFLLLLGAMFWYAEKLYFRLQDHFHKVATVAVASMLIMIVTVNFLSDLIETDKVGSLFFLCLAALVQIDRNTQRN